MPSSERIGAEPNLWHIAGMTWQPINIFSGTDAVTPYLVSDGVRVYYATYNSDDGWHDETVGDEEDGTILSVVKWMPIPAP